MILDEIDASARREGLSLRGIVPPPFDDGVQVRGRPASAILLLGFVGRSGWPEFAASPAAGDGGRDPLDRWSRRVIGALAQRFGAAALFPSDGPPFHPFQRWAARAEAVSPSPIGLLIHPTFGLWHSYRGALAFAERLELPRPAPASSPCETCSGKPCLTACPVDAFTTAGYDVARCRAHVRSEAGGECRTGGCLARRACPVGREHAYGTSQSAFLMRAFAGTS